MFWFIASMMVILFCLAPAYSTVIMQCWFQSSSVNCASNISTSPDFLWIIFHIPCKNCNSIPFPIFCLCISARTITVDLLSFFSFFISVSRYVYTYFTPPCFPIFMVPVRIKFRQWLKRFALGTSFCYDCVRHNRYSYNGYRLEPMTGTIPFSAYYILPHRAEYSIVL